MGHKKLEHYDECESTGCILVMAVRKPSFMEVVVPSSEEPSSSKVAASSFKATASSFKAVEASFVACPLQPVIGKLNIAFSLFYIYYCRHH